MSSSIPRNHTPSSRAVTEPHLWAPCMETSQKTTSVLHKTCIHTAVGLSHPAYFLSHCVWSPPPARKAAVRFLLPAGYHSCLLEPFDFFLPHTDRSRNGIDKRASLGLINHQRLRSNSPDAAVTPHLCHGSLFMIVCLFIVACLDFAFHDESRTKIQSTALLFWSSTLILCCNQTNCVCWFLLIIVGQFRI